MAHEMGRDDDRYRGQNERWSSASRNGNYSGRTEEDYDEGRPRRRRYADAEEDGMSRYGHHGARGEYETGRGMGGEDDRDQGRSTYPQERRGDDWQRRTTYPSRYTRSGARDAGRYEQGGYGRDFGEQDRSQRWPASGAGAMSGGQYGGVGAYGESGRYGQTSGDESGRYGQYGGYGQSTGGFGEQSGYGQSGQRHDRWSRDDEIHDPDYLEWRRNKLKSYDDDYRAWRGERHKKFSDEFDTYRKNRNRSSSESKSTSQTGSSTGAAGGSTKLS